MLRTKLVAASLASGLALSGAYALSAHAAPTPTPTGTPTSAPTSAGKAASFDSDSDKPSYRQGENYTVTVKVTANADGNYTVGYSKVTGATCQGTGSTTVNFSGTNGQPTTKSTSFTCRINSFPVNGTITLTTPDGVKNLRPSSPYTIGGSLPGTPTPTKSTSKPTTTKAPTTKPSTGGLAKTGV